MSAHDGIPEEENEENAICFDWRNFSMSVAAEVRWSSDSGSGLIDWDSGFDSCRDEHRHHFARQRDRRFDNHGCHYHRSRRSPSFSHRPRHHHHWCVFVHEARRRHHHHHFSGCL